MSVTLEEDEIPGLGPDGRPDPAYPASLGIIAVGAGRRAASFAIDCAVYVLLFLPILLGALPVGLRIFESSADPSGWFSHPDFLFGLIMYIIGQGLITIFTIVQLGMHGVAGRTVGKAILGIRSVNVVTFTKPGFWRVVLRAIVFGAAFTVVPYLGAIPFLLSPLWDPEKRGRGWLDRIGRNWLVDVRRGLDPFDIKAFRNAKRALTAPIVEAAQALPSLATGTAWAGTSFVPSGRSSSGVVSLGSADESPAQWNPPEIGAVPAAPPAEPPLTYAAPITAAAPPAPPAPAAPLRASATLIFDDGLSLAVTGTGLLGRSPAAQPGEIVEHLYSIEDAARQLSKTHLAFGIDAQGVWVADRGSSNGTYITTSTGATFALEAMKRTYVEPGSVVEIGDRTFTIGATT